MKSPLCICALVAAAHVAVAGPDLTKEPAPVLDEAVTAAASDSAPTVVGGGVKTTGHFTEGNAFLVAPLWDDLGRHGTMGGSILFAEPYFSWGEEGEISTSLGFGFRHLFSTQTRADALTSTSADLLQEGFFVGANVFVDYMNTQADSNLWQFGVGAEAGTRYIEVRGNYYIPLGDGERVDRFDFTTLEPQRRGGQLTSITARTRTIDVIEEPMEGWDAELAVLVPGLDKWFDVRLMGGYFEFYGGDGGALFSSADIRGWKAGVEVRPVPAVVLSATWYENEFMVDDHWLFGLRLEIPLGKPGSFTPRRRHLQERLVEPVRRQNASINVGVNTEQVGPTQVVHIKSNAQLASFLTQAAQGSSGSSGSIILVTTGGGSQGSSSSSQGATVGIGAATTNVTAGVVRTGAGGSLTLTGVNTTGQTTIGSGSLTGLTAASGATIGGGTVIINFFSGGTLTLNSAVTFTFPANVLFSSLILGRDFTIGGNSVPAGTYPVTGGAIDVGGTVIPLGGAGVAPSTTP
jgi:hypothetical protein